MEHTMHVLSHSWHAIQIFPFGILSLHVPDEQSWHVMHVIFPFSSGRLSYISVGLPITWFVGDSLWQLVHSAWLKGEWFVSAHEVCHGRKIIIMASKTNIILWYQINKGKARLNFC